MYVWPAKRTRLAFKITSVDWQRLTSNAHILQNLSTRLATFENSLNVKTTKVTMIWERTCLNDLRLLVIDQYFIFRCQTFFHILENVFAETLKRLAIDTLVTGKKPKVSYLPDSGTSRPGGGACRGVTSPPPIILSSKSWSELGNFSGIVGHFSYLCKELKPKMRMHQGICWIITNHELPDVL